METVTKFQTIEQARNAAIRWLESRGVVFDGHRKIAIGRLGLLGGNEVGVSASEKPFWRLRLDYDPPKGAHYNAEFGEGGRREKAAFCFPGGEALIGKLAKSRAPR